MPGSLTTTANGQDHTYTYDGNSGAATYFGSYAIAARQLDSEDPITFDIDQRGRVAATGPWTWTFDNPGQMVSGVDDGTTTVRHDADTLLQPTGTTITVDTGGPAPTDVVDVDVTRDDAGRVTSRTVTVDGNTTVERYEYDADGQLTTVRNGADAVIATYAYDDRGNRTSSTEGGSTIPATYDASNRLQLLDGAAVASNANGQVTGIHGLTLDHLPSGELVEVSDAGGTLVTYSYDAMGRRTARVDAAGNTTVYLYGDFSDSTLVTATVFTPTGGGTPVVTEYVHEQGTRFLTALRRDGQWFSVATDVVGTPIAVVDDTGTVVLSRDYSAWGVLRSSSGTFDLPIGFGGGIHDADTGLVRMGVRDYDPATGRWLQPDPTLIRLRRRQPLPLRRKPADDAAGSDRSCGAGRSRCAPTVRASTSRSPVTTADARSASAEVAGPPVAGSDSTPTRVNGGQEIYAQNSCSAGPVRDRLRMPHHLLRPEQPRRRSGEVRDQGSGEDPVRERDDGPVARLLLDPRRLYTDLTAGTRPGSVEQCDRDVDDPRPEPLPHGLRLGVLARRRCNAFLQQPVDHEVERPDLREPEPFHLERCDLGQQLAESVDASGSRRASRRPRPNG